MVNYKVIAVVIFFQIKILCHGIVNLCWHSPTKLALVLEPYLFKALETLVLFR